MFERFEMLHPVVQALAGTVFTWLVTALGAALVFVRKDLSARALDAMLGFAAGVMLAASYWSLLAPAIEMSESGPYPSWFPAVVGFMAGSLFLWAADKLLPHLHLGFRMEESEGIKTNLHRSTLLILAITLHNVPEGLAVGVAFGAAAAGLPAATLGAGVALALGIGLQNFPEGAAVSLPLRREGFSRLRCFWFGQLSAVVEPIAGVIGAAAVLVAQPILPFALSFAAGAMVFVVVDQVIPESQRQNNTDLATMSAMIGFTVMMWLDVSLG